MSMSVKEWANAFGFTKEDLVTQYEVAVYELVEFCESMSDKDLREVFDAVADFHWMTQMVYILSNGERDLDVAMERVVATADKQFGVISKYLSLASQDVLESNYSKLCSSKDALNKTISKYEAMGVLVESEKIGDYWVVRSAANQCVDGKDYGYRKALKSVEFFEPKFSFIKDLL